MNLYQLSESMMAIKAAIDRVLDAETETDDQAARLLQECLAEHEAAFERKVEAVCYAVDERLAVAQAQKEKARQLQEAARTNENKAERLKSYLLSALDAAGRDKVDAGTRRVSVRTASVAPLVWTTPDGNPPAELPERFRRIKIEPDVERIKEELAAGKALDFAKLGERRRYVVLK